MEPPTTTSPTTLTLTKGYFFLRKKCLKSNKPKRRKKFCYLFHLCLLDVLEKIEWCQIIRSRRIIRKYSPLFTIRIFAKKQANIHVQTFGNSDILILPSDVTLGFSNFRALKIPYIYARSQKLR